MEYNFREIEKKWQQQWRDSEAYKVSNESDKPKFYVLDMFPYPSGAGLHVGHPLGYIASDIYARFKRLKGYNVLHPMGFDSFGLPAEQYAIETGQHPAETTEKNIARYREQLDNIGFCYDWSREVRTSDPKYYKWTQWIFLQLFESWYDRKLQKAERIETLKQIFESEGNNKHECPGDKKLKFSAEEWQAFDFQKQQEILMDYRIAFSAFGEVNWCEQLGTVLANDEVVNGVSERGGYPVVKKKMRQWYLRITDYADRLLQGLEQVDFSDAMKEMQRNWIGKSQGAEITFDLKSEKAEGDKLVVYTTRPDTIFGVNFMVIAPEHELVAKITSNAQKGEIDKYLDYVKSRSERERLAEVKSITGAFTGAYALNPFNNREIPVWISEYVLAGYGTGAIMAVPCGDQRDFAFAKHFNIPVTNIIGDAYNGEEANATKDAILQNSEFLDGMVMRDAIDVVIDKLEEMGIGKRQVNYRMRDAGFSRQRYWGEPFPIYYKGGVAYALSEDELPVELPYVDTYGPGPEGEGPLANLKEWVLVPDPSPRVEKGEEARMEKKEAHEGVGAALVPKYSIHTPMQYELAKRMRKEYTEAEGILWEAIRGSKLEVKFRRQHPIDAYIVDFVCLQERLIVEVDGGYHETKEQEEYDWQRTKILEEIGFKVIRFKNNEVINDLKNTVQKIKETITKKQLLSPLSTSGEGPGVRETNTMPGYAGSSWYFLRYMDAHNETEFANRKVTDYWNQVDLYIGGTEHAVGHLLYSRMWTKALYDLGYIGHEEPYKRLVNQGMIQGSSRFIYRLIWFEDASVLPEIFISESLLRSGMENEATNLKIQKRITEILFNKNLPIPQNLNISTTFKRINVEWVDGVILDIDKIKTQPGFQNVEFITEEDGKYICGIEVEKMSKSKYNVVNPDDIVERYGADTFRMYEMFLGPVEQSKPWDTKGIEGVHRFLRKFWRLYVDEVKGLIVTNETPTPAELKVLHKTIKKIEEDTEQFNFNTAVSAFMVCVNELNDLKCHKKDILEPLVILLTPYAPHIAAELYELLKASPAGRLEGVLDASFPAFEQKYLVESSKEYPVSINGKHRTNIKISLDAAQPEVEQIVVANEVVQKWLDGKAPKKIIFVKGKMVNIVI